MAELVEDKQKMIDEEEAAALKRQKRKLEKMPLDEEKPQPKSHKPYWDDSCLDPRLREIGITAKSLEHLNLKYVPIFSQRLKTETCDITILMTAKGPYFHTTLLSKDDDDKEPGEAVGQ